jgi:hypothetical protein
MSAEPIDRLHEEVLADAKRTGHNAWGCHCDDCRAAGLLHERWLTPADLEAAQELVNEASPGPWRTDEVVDTGLDMRFNEAGEVVITHGQGWEADADFIAASRGLVPSLLRRIRFQHDKAIRAQEFWEGKIRGLERDKDQYRFMHSSRCAEVERANARAEKAEALLEEIRALAARSAGSASSTHYELRALLERNPT